MKFLHVGAVLLVPIFLLGCATGEGNVFEATVVSEAGETTSDDESTGNGAPEDETPDEETPEDELGDPPALRVESSPTGADVYLNGREIGETPTAIAGLEPGEYRLRITRTGYYDYTRWIEIEAQQTYILSVTLELITGFLVVQPSVESASLSVDGTSLDAQSQELPVGSYTLRADAFGYEPIVRRIEIRENMTTTVPLDFQKSEFAIAEVNRSRRRFAPQNPGVLGEIAISFGVTAPGSGSVTVRDESGTVLRREELGSFEEPSQRWSWDGTTSAGATVPDGQYRIRVTGESSWTGDTTTEVAETTVVVDSTAIIRYFGGLLTTVGTLYSGDPDVLPAGSVQFTTSFLGHRGVTSLGLIGRYPVAATVRVGLPLELEVVGAASAILYDTVAYTRGIASLAIRRLLTDGRVQTGIVLRGTAQNRSSNGSLAGPDTLANYVGGALSLPVAVRFGDFSILAAPELVLSPVPVSYESGQPPIAPYLWSYGRAALKYDTGELVTAVSTAIRTVPFSEGAAISQPFQVGAEAHLLLPRTPLYVSALLAAEIDAGEGYYLMGGGGIGFVY